jgi:hypothetical protein
MMGRKYISSAIEKPMMVGVISVNRRLCFPYGQSLSGGKTCGNNGANRSESENKIADHGRTPSAGWA